MKLETTLNKYVVFGCIFGEVRYDSGIKSSNWFTLNPIFEDIIKYDHTCVFMFAVKYCKTVE